MAFLLVNYPIINYTTNNINERLIHSLVKIVQIKQMKSYMMIWELHLIPGSRGLPQKASTTYIVMELSFQDLVLNEEQLLQRFLW